MKNLLKQRLKYLIKSLPDPISELLIGAYRIPSKIKTSRLNRRKISNFLKQESIKLELGDCVKKQGWITIDLKEGADLRLNLIGPIPFPSNSIAEIHSEHFFEHLTIKELGPCLRECFRILKPSGEISFSVPDFGKACRAYLSDKDDFYKQKFWTSPSPNWCKCKLDELNFLIYANEMHKVMFDEENGIHRLEEAGFKNCRIRNYDPRKDNQHKKDQSLYFVGEKR